MRVCARVCVCVCVCGLVCVCAYVRVCVHTDTHTNTKVHLTSAIFNSTSLRTYKTYRLKATALQSMHTTHRHGTSQTPRKNLGIHHSTARQHLLHRSVLMSSKTTSKRARSTKGPCTLPSAWVSFYHPCLFPPGKRDASSSQSCTSTYQAVEFAQALWWRPGQRRWMG